MILTECGESKIDSMCNRARVKPCVMFYMCVDEKYNTKNRKIK
jgi:hypothetical protein